GASYALQPFSYFMETAFVENKRTFKFPLLFSQFHLQFTNNLENPCKGMMTSSIIVVKHPGKRTNECIFTMKAANIQ
ncbi:hypothetical protein, partial [Anaerotruncus colihominis]|uniref:hypothetical protein n=1 Tax=Anaerotruncus colihominis TaxID=169435 RepID=UPI0024324E21